MGKPAQIGLSINEKGQVTVNGSLKISEYVVHPEISLIFKIQYKVFIKEMTGLERFQDFTIGWGIYLPELTNSNTEIAEKQISLKLLMGPGSAITGEIMWDGSSQKTGKNPKPASVKLDALISTSELSIKPTVTFASPTHAAAVSPINSALQRQLSKIRESI